MACYYYQHKERQDELGAIISEGATTTDAWTLASLMVMKEKTVNCLQDVKDEYLYILNWKVNEALFLKGWPDRRTEVEEIVDAVKGAAINGYKGGKASAAKRAAKAHPQPTNESEV